MKVPNADEAMKLLKDRDLTSLAHDAIAIDRLRNESGKGLEALIVSLLKLGKVPPGSEIGFFLAIGLLQAFNEPPAIHPKHEQS
jgi:hypothetical protein